ncbi:MAG: PAS domain S-box-containing protein [Desulforhopalus sp.]|jgi:PAS domain S-box-containing protein
MLSVQAAELPPYECDFKELFYQRTLLCLWLAVVFFSIFSVLDFVCCRDHFGLFFMYRMIYVVTVLGFINVLSLPTCKKYAPHLIYAAMVLGGLAISLMIVGIGGFYSGYYVGILLMIAGTLSVLPLKIAQVVFIGLSMYLIYILTVLAGTGDMEEAHLVSMLNNSFFFFALIGITAVQSNDDFRTLLKSIRATTNLKSIRGELTNYTGGLENLVQKRLKDLEETDLKYRDLYNSILDLIVLIDNKGVIKKINQHSAVTLGYSPEQLEGKLLVDFIYEDEDKAAVRQIIEELSGESKVEGVQLQLQNSSGHILDVELSANRVIIENKVYFQFVIRDISVTKAMEMQLLDSERLIDTSRQVAIFGLARLAECRDDDTGAHLKRIRLYTGILIKELAQLPALSEIITSGFIESLIRSSVLHDIGKVGTPDAILLKPGRLTKEEFEVMKLHCQYGSDILAGAVPGEESVSFLLLAKKIARHHHERWDGKGYPDGLSGEDIPFAARVVSLADVYDALTSTRVYKAAYNHEEAKELILKERGGQFDPTIVDAFIRKELEFKESRMQILLHK